MVAGKGEAALKDGKAEIRVKRSGFYQRCTFVIKRIDTPVGSYPVLFFEKFLDSDELPRIAEEYGLPVMAKNGTAFPRGKGMKDFVGL